MWVMDLSFHANAEVVVEWEKTFENRVANSVVETADRGMERLSPSGQIVTFMQKH